MSVPLHIAERTAGHVVLLELRGRLVVDEGGSVLRDHVRSLVGRGQTAILIDLGEVSYIDSGGIGVLIQMYKEVTKLGGQFKLLHPSGRSAHVLEITLLTTVFEIFADEETALRSMTRDVR
jgi:anti-sigma B factor antagonist